MADPDTADTFSAESRLIHAGTERTPGLPATPPLAPASIYVSAGPPRPGRAYGRDGNPGWEALEQALGGLEDAEAVAFASGQAASMALMLALAPGRERIVLPNDGYYGGRVLADRLRPHGAVPVPVDLQDLAAVERELTAAPSVLWAETPTNPLLRVADLARLGALAAAAGAPMVVDNTVATGLLQRPLEAGATASLYSLTKSVSGHSDVILGAVVSRDAELLAALRAWRSSGGGIPGPFEAWLALRGLKTLPLRIARQSASALAIARHLAGHPRVAAVHYPGIDKATSELARRQMPDGFGPLLSFEVTPDSADAADKVVASSRLILPATSFGGVESTWERRARWPAETAPAGLIRLSVGVEPAADLITDIDQALEVLLCDVPRELRARRRPGPDRSRGRGGVPDHRGLLGPLAWRAGHQAPDRRGLAGHRGVRPAGAMVGFARAFSDGGSAYLADVYVLPAHRGAGLGKAIVAMMIEEGPGAGFRWMLHTSDAYGLYRQFGFARRRTTTWTAPGGPAGRASPERGVRGVVPRAAQPLTGEHVRLEPLGMRHVPGLLRRRPRIASLYQWVMVPQDEPAMRRHVEDALAARARGSRCRSRWSGWRTRPSSARPGSTSSTTGPGPRPPGTPTPARSATPGWPARRCAPARTPR